MRSYIAGFSGLASTGEGGTKEIAERIPGARHYTNPLPLDRTQVYVREIVEAKPDFIALFGHSKGAETVLKIAAALVEHRIVVDYIAIIDMTLLSDGVAGPNIRVLDEFHSAYAKANIGADFMGKHNFHDLDEVTGENIGHSEAARLPFTQNKIVSAIVNMQGARALNELSQTAPVNGRKISPRVALEIAYHEGLVQQAYKDSKGIWTWSIGVTSLSGHKVERYIGNPVPIRRCLEVYIWLLDKVYAPAVHRAFEGRELTEEQFTAAMSFHWNTGGIERAKWVEKWLAGDMDGARASFMNWRKPPEIVPRRRSERDLFFDGDWSGNGTVAHYQSVNGSGNPINPVRLDITDIMTEVIDAHYTQTEPLPDTPVVDSDLDQARDTLAQYFPKLTEQNRELVLALAMVLGRSPPDNKSAESTLASPALEPGFLLPENTKEIVMSEKKSPFASKGVWGSIVSLAATVLFAWKGIEIDESMQSQIVEILIVIAGGGGGLLSLFGRLFAKSRIA